MYCNHKAFPNKQKGRLFVFLTIDMLAEQLHVSEMTIRRKLADSRAGRSNFPLPITGAKKKAIWRTDQFENWNESEIPAGTFGKKKVIFDEAIEREADEYLANRFSKKHRKPITDNC